MASLTHSLIPQAKGIKLMAKITRIREQEKRLDPMLKLIYSKHYLETVIDDEGTRIADVRGKVGLSR